MGQNKHILDMNSLINVNISNAIGDNGRSWAKIQITQNIPVTDHSSSKY